MLLTLDASHGESGGQVLRTALGLAVALGRPVELQATWRRSGAAIDEHLADQLVPFLALAGEPSSFTCPALSSHLRTVAWVVQQFLPVRVELEEGPPARVTLGPPR